MSGFQGKEVPLLLLQGWGTRELKMHVSPPVSQGHFSRCAPHLTFSESCFSSSCHWRGRDNLAAGLCPQVPFLRQVRRDSHCALCALTPSGLPTLCSLLVCVSKGQPFSVTSLLLGRRPCTNMLNTLNFTNNVLFQKDHPAQHCMFSVFLRQGPTV